MFTQNFCVILKQKLKKERMREMTAIAEARQKTEKTDERKEILYIKTGSIIPNRAQPREFFDEKSLSELTESIRMFGILQPLTVRKNPEKSRFSLFQYELIAGERRLRAAKRLGMEEVPCILVETNAKTSAELAIIENLHRKDLGIFEEASAIASLIELHSLTQEQVAERLSLTQASVANKLRILKLTPEEKTLITKNNLTERHARAVLRIKDPDLRKKALKHIVEKMFHVKQTEEYVEKILSEADNSTKGTKPASPKPIDIPRLILNIENSVKSARINGNKIKTQHAETDTDIIITVSIPKQ